MVAHSRYGPRLLVLSCAVCLCLSTGCARQRPADAAAVPAQGQPIYHAEQLPPILAEPYGSLRHDTTVKNETGRMVHFVRVQTSCSCSGGTTLETMEFAPGQETVLHFDINLQSRTGPQRFVCRLLEDNGTEWTYELATTIYEPARFGSRGGTHFGMIDPNAEEAREGEFILVADSPANLPQDISFTAGSEALQIEPGPAADEVQEDGVAVRKVPLKFRLRAPATPGLGQVRAAVQFERQGAKQQVETTVDWNVRTFYSVSPAQVYFGTVEPGDGAVERRVIIRVLDRDSLTIKEAKVSCPGVRCSVEKPRQSGTGELLLVLDPGSVSGPLLGEVIVETDHPVQPTVKIPLAAIPKRMD
jgi:hypothetical protein